MKIYLTILLSFLLAPAFVLAAKTDVTMSNSSVITVGVYPLTVSGTASFDSITVNASDFSIIMSFNGELIVTSADRRNFTVSPSQYKTGFTCGTSESTLTLKNISNNDAATITVTPSSSACSMEGGGGGGGGGGGSSGSYAPVVPSQNTTPAAIAQALTTTPTAPSATIVVSVSPVFVKTFNVGATSNDVKRLQQILNANPDTKVASSGAGSSGKETTYFGPATTKAVQKFQCKYSIICSGMPTTTGYGNLGPKTRTKIQEVFKKQ